MIVEVNLIKNLHLFCDVWQCYKITLAIEQTAKLRHNALFASSKILVLYSLSRPNASYIKTNSRRDARLDTQALFTLFATKMR